MTTYSTESALANNAESEGNEPLASSSNKDDAAISESSNEAESIAMKTLDNLVEQQPKNPSLIGKKIQIATATTPNGLKHNQSSMNATKQETVISAETKTATESDRKLINRYTIFGILLY
ncbi:unnamed protein product [Thelazia callipaeda]|uniref:Uncharacterized protein n=1 Tax=Thelazia callipaeda TaxID=103827 RepID=A0A0N5CRZ2_THECL|nr:unnamed protein product [Thelazia callipaeda]